MPRKRKVVKAQETEQDQMPSQDIFEAMGMETPGKTKDEDVADGTPAVTVEELLKKLEAVNSRLDAAESANMALTTHVDTQAAPKPPDAVSYEGLPDPVTDPEAYGRELHTRISNNFQAQQNYQAQLNQRQQGQNSQYDTLWEDFSIAYPDIAEDADTVEVIAAKVVKSAQKRGIDPQRYMFNNRDKFMADVAKEYNRLLGPKEEVEDAENTTANRRVAKPDDTETNRTAGIFGGQESGGAPNKGKRNEGGSDMVKDLQDMQRASGFY